MTRPRELTAEQLRRRCDTAQFTFTSTADVPDLEGIIGQERAARGNRVRHRDPLSGVQHLRHGPDRGRQNEHHHPFPGAQGGHPCGARRLGLCHNFTDPDRPNACVYRPRGMQAAGPDRHPVWRGIADALDKAFARRSIRGAPQRVGPRAGSTTRGTVQASRRLPLAKQGFTLARSPMGMMVAPVKDGQPLTPEQFEALPEKERET